MINLFIAFVEEQQEEWKGWLYAATLVLISLGKSFFDTRSLSSSPPRRRLLRHQVLERNRASVNAGLHRPVRGRLQEILDAVVHRSKPVHCWPGAFLKYKAELKDDTMVASDSP